MKFVRAVAVALAVLGGTVASSSARAVQICTGCTPSAAGDTFLGTHNPTTDDQSTFTRQQITAGGFDDWWIFAINPAGLASMNATFNPDSDI